MKKKNNDKYLLIGVVCVIVLACLITGYRYINDHNLFKTNTLNKTEVNTKIKEGIYLTDVSEVVENAMPSIVSITSKTLVQSGYYGPFSFGNSEEQYAEGAGSGIIVSNSDDEILILTNNHVVADAEELDVQFIDDKKVDAEVKGTTKKKDIAVISVKIKDLEKSTLDKIKVATIGNSKELKVGNGIIAIGNALGYGQSVTTGVVSALDRDLQNDNSNTKYIQIDAAINGGNSGGALLNSKGEVVGINSAKYSSSGSSTQASIEGMGFAIPITDVEDIINSLINGEEPDEGITLGIGGYMTTDSNLKGYNLPEGFYVSQIDKGSYAAKSDLEIGNIITEIEGKKVTSVDTITKVLETKKKNESVKLKVKYASKSEYKEKEITVNFK